MAVYSIKAVKYCEQSAPGPQMFYLSAWDRWVDVYFYFFILRRDDGRIALVDTGVRDVDEINPFIVAGVGERGRFRMAMERESVPLLLRREGVDPAQVDYVFLTHFHYDHCSNVRLFPNARIVVSRRGWLATLAPKHLKMVPDPVFPRDILAYLANEARERLILADDDEKEVAPGIGVFYTGGHTMCSQAVRVNTVEGTAVLTGDVIFLYENLEKDHPVGLNVNLTECYDAMAKIRREADIIVPPHDPELLARYPGGVVI
jgi:N-acyl homoserine lactone hydrolase